MKFKLRQIINMRKSLAKIANQEVSIDKAFVIARNIKFFNQEIENFDERRNELIKKYSTDKTTVDKDKEEDFFKELQVLLDVEVEIDLIPVDLSQIKDIKLTAMDLIVLDSIVKLGEK